MVTSDCQAAEESGAQSSTHSPELMLIELLRDARETLLSTGREAAQRRTALMSALGSSRLTRRLMDLRNRFRTLVYSYPTTQSPLMKNKRETSEWTSTAAEPEEKNPENPVNT